VKYIRHETEGFILFTRSDRVIWHAVVAKRLFGDSGKIVSAGFVSVRDGVPTCHGMSESLGVRSREDDTKALCDTLGITMPNAHPHGRAPARTVQGVVVHSSSEGGRE